MASLSKINIFLFAFVCFFIVTYAFNFDTVAPIIKEGSVDSYFGFSVAQHRIAGAAGHVFLVGAPRDNITDPGVSQVVRNLKRPGAVYSCPLTSLTDDCTWLNIDADEPYRDDQKADQWLGVSVASTGSADGGAVACAHRYTQGADTDAYRWGLGQCIAMTNTLDEDSFLTPCHSLPKNELHTDYGLCQAGISVALDMEGDVLVGAPGSRAWRGAVFKNTIERSLESDTTWYQSPADPPTLSQPDNRPAVRQYSYLGMSATIAQLIPDGPKTYITGAPRSVDVGQVLLFTLADKSLSVDDEDYLSGEQFGSWFGCSFAVLDLNKDGRKDLVVGAPFYHDEMVGGAVYVYLNSRSGITWRTRPLRITSRKLTRKECDELDCENARFGSAVAAVGDVDRDGYQDFAVGAPYEGRGAVYIFRGQPGPRGVADGYSQRIAAEDLPTAGPELRSFGYSLSGGQDMDGNGYPDLVVGNFQADMALVLRTRPVVHMTAVMHSYPVKIDPNVHTCFKDNKGNNCFELTLCFNFSAEPQSHFSGSLSLDYKLEAERFTGKVTSRVTFKGADKSKGHLIEHEVNVRPQSSLERTCLEHLVYINSNTKDFYNAIQFRLSYGLSDSAVTAPVMTPGGPVPNINLFPIFDQTSTEIFHSVPFQKNCGSNELCESDLRMELYFRDLQMDESGPVLRIGQVEELKLEVTVRNKGEDAHDTNLYLTLPPEVNWVGTRDLMDAARAGQGPACLNSPEEPLVWACPVGNPLHSASHYSFLVLLRPRDVTPATRYMNFTLQVNTTSINLNPDNTLMQPVRVIVETNLYIRGSSDPSEVFYSGEVRGESDLKFEEDIGSQVIHTYEMRNTMAGVVERSSITISWPYEVQSNLQHGKHLLYLMEAPMVNDKSLVKCTIPSGHVINPVGIRENPRWKLENQRHRPIIGTEGNYTVLAGESRDRGEEGSDLGVSEGSRRRRKREDVIRSEPVLDGSGKKFQVVTMDCRKGTARCFDIVCAVGALRKDDHVVITLRARLWNHTFVEDYRNVDRVEIFSSARLEIDPELNIQEPNTKDNTAEALTRAIPDIKVQPKETIPWWIILLAIVGGLILLIIIVIIMWKFGLFKRMRPDDLQQHKGKLQKKKLEDDEL